MTKSPYLDVKLTPKMCRTLLTLTRRAKEAALVHYAGGLKVEHCRAIEDRLGRALCGEGETE